PIRNSGILIRQPRAISIAGLRNREQTARTLDRNAMVRYRLGGHLFPVRWPHHFFAIASRRISQSILDSTYIVFSRRFSSSSSRKRVMLDTSMPPYLARHL